MGMSTRTSFILCVVFVAMGLIAPAYADITVTEVSARALEVVAGHGAELDVKGQDLNRVRSVQFFQGTRRVGALTGKLKGRSSTNQTLEVRARRGAEPGSYSIKLIGGKTLVTLPTLLEVVPGGTRRPPHSKEADSKSKDWRATTGETPQCPPGQQLGSSGCEPCQAGTYKATSGGMRCVPVEACPAGQFRTGVSATSGGRCVTCAPGTYKNFVGAAGSHCQRSEACPAGQFRTGVSATSGGRCVTCAPGTYKNFVGDAGSQCQRSEACPAGQFRTGVSATSGGRCVACATGTYKNFVGDAGSQCVLCNECAAGSEMTGCGGRNQGTCEMCRSGTYKATSGGMRCVPVEACPAGQFRTGVSATSGGRCVTCATGTYKNFVGDAGSQCVLCNECAAGFERRDCGGARAGRCEER